MACSSKRRATGIARRTPEFIMRKMSEGLAVIVIDAENGAWTGFCYLEVWQHRRYVANSGLIVSPGYRGMGISKEIKITLFNYSRAMFPGAKLFSLSTSPAVTHINKELGYRIVPFTEIMNDDLFLTGCQSWVNYRELMTETQTRLPYVAMVFDPKAKCNQRKKTLVLLPLLQKTDELIFASRVAG